MCVCACVRASVRVRVRASVRVRECACARVCVSACVRVCVGACVCVLVLSMFSVSHCCLSQLETSQVSPKNRKAV